MGVSFAAVGGDRQPASLPSARHRGLRDDNEWLHRRTPAGRSGDLQFDCGSWIVAASIANAHRVGRTGMAKGQLRSHKEKKKPKQSKVPTAAVTPYGSTPKKTPTHDPGT